MKNIIAFLISICFYASLVAASALESQVVSQDQQLHAIALQCARFDLDMEGVDRSMNMEKAAALVDNAWDLHKQSVVEFVNFGLPYGQDGIGLGRVQEVLPHLLLVQKREKLRRSVLVYSTQRLVDAIMSKKNSYSAPPSEKDVSDEIFALKSQKNRRQFLLSAPYVEKVEAVEIYLGLKNKIFCEDLVKQPGSVQKVALPKNSCCEIM